MNGHATACPLDLDWLCQLSESVPAYLAKLRSGDQPGRFIPCLRGATPIGREMALGWSCFALKTTWMLDRWSILTEMEQGSWLRFLQSFQRGDGENAFADPPEIAFLDTYIPWRERVRGWLGLTETTRSARAITLAETKQAIATLEQVNGSTLRVFNGFPSTPEEVRVWLEAQDWSQPWGAGGQAAGLVVFIKTQAPKFLPAAQVEALLAVCRDFFQSLADPITGGYFRGRCPAHGELINGAMKILTALEWLNVEPHYPAQLVATTLRERPAGRGCHLVDAVYVLHQCHNGREASSVVRDFCLSIFAEIRHHAKPDGGFSFYRNKAQDIYYGVPVSRGLAESDIQGTCLLVWAIAMIWKLLSPGTAAWRPMRP